MKAYPHLVNPEQYPGYDPETSQIVPRSALGDRIRFTGLKFFSVEPKTGRLTGVRRDIHLFVDHLKLCDCLLPHWTVLFAPNAKEVVDIAVEKNLLLGGFWGFVPGFEAIRTQQPPWGEFIIPEEMHAYLIEQMGSGFLGYESGENDGRYIGGYAATAATAAHSHRENYRLLVDFHERIGDSLCNRMMQYSSLNMGHYTAKLGNVTMLGAETGQSNLHAPMWYAFIRGAAKQYGLLTFGGVSTWNRWGYKVYGSSGKQDDGPDWGPTKGISLSLMRRLMYQQYFYNCDMLGIQQNWLDGDDGEMWMVGEVQQLPGIGEEKLSPIGLLQQSAYRFAREHGSLGTFHAPVALMLDFYAGWLPPRHHYSSALYKTWGSLPYRAGDYQAHALFSMLYPGYENAGWYNDESGFLTATPYGDMTDVLLSDADPAVMGRYGVLLLTNDIDWTYEFYHNLLTYVRQGGHVVVCAGAVEKHRARLEALDEAYLSHFGVTELRGEISAGLDTAFYQGCTYPQAELTGFAATPTAGAQVVATLGSQPLILRTSLGEGHISLILSDTALEPCDRESLTFNTVNNDIVTPYVFTPAVQAYIGDLYRAHTPVYPTNELLQHSVAVADATHVVLQVTNNTHYAQAFDMRSSLTVADVEPLPIEDGISSCEGYYSANTEVNNEVEGGSGSYRLEAGDVCFYRVTLDTPLSLMAERLPARQVQNLYVKLLPDSGSLQQFVLDHPTFTQRFTGVTVDATYLMQHDRAHLQREADFLRRQGVRVLVDFLPLLSHYPGLSFLRSFPRRYRESITMAEDILRKAELFDCAGALLGVVRNAEACADASDLQRDMLETFERLAQSTRLPLYMVNRPIAFQIDEAFGVAEEANGVRLALDTCGAMCVYMSPARVYHRHPIHALCISAPETDRYDQRYHAHRPLYNSPAGEELRHFASIAEGQDFLFLCADYQNWDEVVRDYVYLFETDY